jgi:hypothetical protein
MIHSRRRDITDNDERSVKSLEEDVNEKPEKAIATKENICVATARPP